MRLDQLDERLLPRAAVGLRTLLDAAAERRARTSDSARRMARVARDPSPESPLRRLDDRFASHGPLALIRDLPQLGLLLAAAVLLAGSTVALERSGSPSRQPSELSRAEAATPSSLGPLPGTNIPAYLAATRSRAVLLSRGVPDKTYVALVSFSGYFTAGQAAALLSGHIEIKKVLARVPLPEAEVLPIPITTTLEGDVAVTFAAVAQRKSKDRTEFTNLAASISGHTKAESQFKAFYLAAATTSGKEAAAYAQNCACLFAALVRAKARDLAALPALSGVRAVDIGSGSDDTLQLEPLLPEQTLTVLRPVTPAQGNRA